MGSEKETKNAGVLVATASRAAGKRKSSWEGWRRGPLTYAVDAEGVGEKSACFGEVLPMMPALPRKGRARTDDSASLRDLIEVLGAARLGAEPRGGAHRGKPRSGRPL